jgi:hypothetical protein
LASDTLSAAIGTGTFSARKLGDTPVGTAGPQAVTHLVLDASGADPLRLRMDFAPVSANMAWECTNVGLPYSSQPVPMAGCAGALTSRYTGFVSLESMLVSNSQG